MIFALQALAVWLAVSGMLWVTTWVLFLALASLVRAEAAGTLVRQARPLAKAVVAVGALSDFALNWWFLTPALLDVRMQWLVTQHLEVLMDKPSWRGRAARYLCTVWLDPFDPSGCHCKHRD